MKAYHTHGKDDYGTPKPLFDLLDAEFHLTLDVCADAQNAKCDQFLTKEMDALSIDWWGRVFMNPPFSLLDKFLIKLIKELMAGHIEMGVALIAARSDTQAMFLASSYAGETRFLKGRVSYLVYPTEWQRAACAAMNGVMIDPDAWPGLVKEIGLPKMAVLALVLDPTIPGGDPLLAQSAPFPSTVLIFDRRSKQGTVYWDWKKKVKTSYVFEGKDPKKFPWEGKKPISGKMLFGSSDGPGKPVTTVPVEVNPNDPSEFMADPPEWKFGFTGFHPAENVIKGPGKAYTKGEVFSIGKKITTSGPSQADWEALKAMAKLVELTDMKNDYANKIFSSPLVDPGKVHFLSTPYGSVNPFGLLMGVDWGKEVDQVKKELHKALPAAPSEAESTDPSLTPMEIADIIEETLAAAEAGPGWDSDAPDPEDDPLTESKIAGIQTLTPLTPLTPLKE